MESNARLIRPLIGVLLTAVTACSRGPYCYEWQKAYSRGDAAQTTAAHQQWLLAHLPEDILKLVKDEKGIIDRTRLAELEHLVLVNCEPARDASCDDSA